jgi:F-type H+-transporting ATPase subunit gamma
MASLKELKQRRKSTQSILKVTSAMKMISAGKLKKSQDAMVRARPYSAKIKEVMQMLVYGAEKFTSEFFIRRPGDRTLYVVITSDRGLCGGFNASIIKTFFSLFCAGDSVIAVGNKIVSALERRGDDAVSLHRNAFADLDFALAAQIGGEIVKHYLSNRADRVVLIYNRFESALSQIVMREQLLPVELERRELATGKFMNTQMATEPDPGALFDQMFPRYVNFLIWRGMLESHASENAARMTTMDSATENARDMLGRFTLDINKARQAAITRELSEIVGGSSFGE